MPARSKPKTSTTLSVKECTVDNLKAFGITNGKTWFFYAYKTRQRAQAMIPHFDTPGRVTVNISQPQAFKLVE